MLSSLNVSFVRSRAAGDIRHKRRSTTWVAAMQLHLTLPVPKDNGCRLDVLNALLESLLRSELHINKYWHTIGAMALKKDGSGGTTAFWTTKSGPDTWQVTYPGLNSWKHNNTRRNNNITVFDADDGKNLRTRERETLSLTTGLPDHPRDWILELVNTLEDYHRVNLDTNQDYYNIMAPSYVCWLWHLINLDFLEHNRYDFEVTYADDQGNINDFWKLERFMRIQCETLTPLLFSGIRMPFYGKAVQLRIFIIFHQNTPLPRWVSSSK